MFKSILTALALTATIFGGTAAMAGSADRIGGATVTAAPSGGLTYVAPTNKWGFNECGREFYSFASAAEAAGFGHIDNPKRGGCVLKVDGPYSPKTFGTVVIKPPFAPNQGYLVAAGSNVRMGTAGKGSTLYGAKVTAASAANGVLNVRMDMRVTCGTKAVVVSNISAAIRLSGNTPQVQWPSNTPTRARVCGQ